MVPFLPGKRGLELAIDALIATERWCVTEGNKLQAVFGYDVPMVKTLYGHASYVRNVLGCLERPAQGIAARSDETPKEVQPERQEPGPEGMRPNTDSAIHQPIGEG